jgi:hypothetical protein
MANDIVNVEPDDSLKTWGWISYILHLIVAIGAVLPGAQASVALLLLALLIDFIKRDNSRPAPGRPRISAGASARCCGPACCTS